ncbi:MAG TPA: iron-sulfur cluster assembly protein [Bacteroidota bacterium]|nr:iron-sulfur cluster assembly protein [Bacteroidota bacterium]
MEENQLNSFEIIVIKEEVVNTLRTVYDPEIPVDIYELGLVYSVDVDTNGVAAITMTLTSPMCPAAQSLPPEIKEKVETVKGITRADVNVVWEPRWDPSMMTEAAKLALNM